MSKLKQYLSENFSGPFSDIALVEHFKEQYGVDVKINGDLFLFKYDQIEANWKHDIVRECRGVIFRYVYPYWEIVSRPWDKFFNFGESGCLIRSWEDISGGYLFDKLDGSCIQVYNDGERVRISTLGAIDTANVGDMDFTFSDLFIRVYGGIPECEEGYTQLYELCTPYNRIVTKYDTPRIYLLGVYDHSMVYDQGRVDSILAENPKLMTPRKILVDDVCSSVEELMKYIEEEGDKTEIGLNPEGFVFYKDMIPMAKFKNRKYVALHHVMTGDRAYVKKNLVRLFFQGKIDDVMSDLMPEQIEFCEKLRNKYREVLSKIRECENKLVGVVDQKEYALIVQGSEVYDFKAYFFEKKKQDISFFDWITSAKKYSSDPRYENYMDFWREV